MQCQKPGCNGEYKDDICNACGLNMTPPAATPAQAGQSDDSKNVSPDSSNTVRNRRKSPEVQLQSISAKLKSLSDTQIAKNDLLQAAESLTTVVPDRFEAWRAQADLWLTAIRQLETRQVSPDDNVYLMGVPLREAELRDAAEDALRQCAHHAPTADQRIALIDEANSIRKMTWF